MAAVAMIIAVPTLVSAADIVDTAKADGHFTMLLKASEQAGAANWLKSPGPITVFAPNDDAFAKLPPPMVASLLAPANAEKLKLTVGGHAVAGLVTVEDINRGLSSNAAVVVPAMSGMALVIKREGGVLTVNGAHVIKGPMQVDNGIVYVIDAVLVPPMPIQPRL